MDSKGRETPNTIAQRLSSIFDRIYEDSQKKPTLDFKQNVLQNFDTTKPFWKDVSDEQIENLIRNIILLQYFAPEEDWVPGARAVEMYNKLKSIVFIINFDKDNNFLSEKGKKLLSTGKTRVIVALKIDVIKNRVLEITALQDGSKEIIEKLNITPLEIEQFREDKEKQQDAVNPASYLNNSDNINNTSTPRQFSPALGFLIKTEINSERLGSIFSALTIVISHLNLFSAEGKNFLKHLTIKWLKCLSEEKALIEEIIPEAERLIKAATSSPEQERKRKDLN